MNIDEEDVNVDSNSNALSESISFFNTTTNLYNIFQSFLGEIPCFTPHGTLDSLCDSPNFDIAKMKQRWWSGIAHAAPLESELELEDEDLAYTPSIEELRNSYF